MRAPIILGKSILRLSAVVVVVFLLNQASVTPSMAGDDDFIASSVPDSVRMALQDLQGEQRVDALMDLARKSFRNDPQYSHQVLTEALEYSKDINFELGIARANNGLGVVSQLMGQYTLGLVYFQDALAGFESIKDKEGQGSALSNISSVQLTLNLHEEALATCQRALIIRQELGDEVELAKSIRGMGIIHRGMGNLDMALEYSMENLALVRKFGDKKGEAKALSTIGTIQSELGMDEESQVSCLESISLARSENDAYGLGVALVNLGEVYLNVEKWDEALDVANEALSLSNKLQVKTLMESAHRILAKSYEETGRPKLALQHFHKYRALKSELFNEETSMRIAELTARFEVARDRNRLLVLEQSRVTQALELEVERRQRAIFLVGFSISLPLAVLVFVLYRKSQTAKEVLSVKAVELEKALGNLKTMEGLIPICASCKNIRDDAGYWHKVEEYVMKHSLAEFSHGICPQCTERLYGDLLEDDESAEENPECL